MSHRIKIVVVSWMMLAAVLGGSMRFVQAADLSGAAVKDAIERGKKFLVSQQAANGSWSNDKENETVGVTSLVLLALINSGMTPQDVPVKRGLQFLRALKANEPNAHPETYQVALVIMALAVAKDGAADQARISHLAQRLESGQMMKGNSGAWGYGLGGGGDLVGGDNSNTQFAILGLREAVEAGAVVSRETWQRNRDYWVRGQNHDGGWAYTNHGGGDGSYGSMTVAGVSSLAICEQMLRTDAGVAPDGTPPCCQDPEIDKDLQQGLEWLAKHFSAGHNPGSPNGNVLYYIYGAERAGRLSGQRFFGEHDWYREGAAYLVAMQNAVAGRWDGAGHGETSPIVATSYALLFLSKGLAPVLVNKLKYGPRDQGRPLEVVGDDWNKHRRDIRNLTEHISGQPKWPKLLTSQEVDLARAVKSDGVNSLLQAPVLFITGKERPQFAPEELKLLKEYLQEGGFIFATPTCQSTEFEAGLREVLIQILPPGEGELKPLQPDHPVFRSERPLTPHDAEHPNGVKLFGVDFGCRTTVIYSPEDLGCLWDYWARQEPPRRNPQFKAKIMRATDIGVNVLAYATGREPPDKTAAPKKVAETADLDNVERGLLQIAQIKHDGAWNAAPRALRNLLLALNDTVGLAASTKTHDLTLADPNVFQHPILYMHGRNRFAMNADERKQLKEYLSRGGFLFADACCGAKPFDRGFREFANSLYPDKKLERIPVDHELFSEKIGRDIRRLKRRTQEATDPNAGASMTVREAEPFLEGIEIDGRLAVVYSKYDISCALERQAAGNCEGYLPEDAVKLATNIVLYALLQDLHLADPKAAVPK